MESIGVRELRQNASKYLDRVKKGETIQVTERGVPIAVLGPVPVGPETLIDRLIASGEMIPAQGNLWEWLAENPPIPPEPGYEGPTATELLIQSREEERY
ncbi:MAG: type II toxin-antitoxin system prevent-host-death family antitoxin [Salinibacterium sp.]|nr:MAG: type II toxin-antitoxin system prevent-host-death family antitoxin [Salinibacterium sp.]